MVKLYKHSKRIAWLLLLTFVFEILAPIQVLGLTSGPSQPETQSFEPVGTTDMVDMFTGDFNYNIPLMDVDGYPINIAYHGGVTMDQEASWVGLGWNLNPGVINRNMRGLPDDYNGDEITEINHIKNQHTWGMKYDHGWRVFAKNINDIGDKKRVKKFINKLLQSDYEGNDPRQRPYAGLTLSMGFSVNNYKGVGIDFGIDPSLRVKIPSLPLQLSASSNLTFSTKDGFDAQSNMSLEGRFTNKKNKHQIGIGLDASTSFNSREGMKSRSFGFGSIPKGPISENISAGYNQTFGTRAWTPHMSVATTSFSTSISFKYGREFQFINKYNGGDGFYSNVKYKSGSQTLGSYGYLYEHNKPSDEVLLDFNREKDGMYLETAQHLPITVHTFDIYSVTGHGTGGVFRPFRGDVGMLHNNYVNSMPDNENKVVGIAKSQIGKLASLGAGIEIGKSMVPPDLSTQIGINLSAVFQKSFTGPWNTNNLATHSYAFKGKTSNNTHIAYEPSYFKMIGEYTKLDEEYYFKLGKDTLVKPVMSSENASDRLMSTTGVSYSPSDVPHPNVSYKVNRDKRNTNISYLTAVEASSFGLSRSIESYPLNNSEERISSESILDPNLSARQDTAKKAHHISEITIINEDGSRYIYDVPAYNNFQKEKSFNVGEKSLDSSNHIDVFNNLVSYTTTDRSVDNTKGVDHYFQSVATPAHAHSYLLTAVLSPDYIDRTDNGVSDDDLGSVVKINYTRVNHDFRWRVPFKENFANFSQGDKSNEIDDKGSFIYGSKEIWYMQSIVGKNHVAIFEISERADAFGVSDEDGGIGSSSKQYKLDRITLFAKHDWLKNGWDAYAIKTVHFEYDYSLCPNVENNSGAVVSNPYNGSVNDNLNKGKLTLKKIWFTHGTSHKGRLTPYVFQYNGYNPNYCAAGHDRWGNYAPNNKSGSGLNNSQIPTTGEFPFTTQVKDSADKFAGSWSMTDIILPSGGKITINYESDDYSHVMDKGAMCMYMLEGFASTADYSKTTDYLYSKSKKGEANTYVFVKLINPINTGNAAEDKKKFRSLFKNQNHLIQFNLLALIRNYKGKDYYEYVRAYADISSDTAHFGVCNNGNSAFFKLKEINFSKRDGENTKANSPITQLTEAIWNFARLNTPYLVYPMSDKVMRDENHKFSKFKSLGPFFMKMAKMFTGGINSFLYSSGFGQRVALNKSWVRLNAPDHKKLGGGHRIKRITMNDNWNSMAEGKTSNQTYGQEYEYTDTTGNSSGVAAYEPSIGNDENPFHIPHYTTQKIKWIPDLKIMTDDPFGESFFPAPTVGYSRVKVANITPSGVESTATGYTVNEFYTARDFPVNVSFSPLDQKLVKPKWSFALRVQKTSTTASQGYKIELNDMHGKPKQQLVYGQRSKNNVPISGVVYKYNTKEENGVEMLNNKVKLIKTNGDIINGEIGVDIDFVMDSRMAYNYTRSHNFNYNFELGGVPAFPVPFFLALLFSKVDESKFQSLVATKVVNRKGILQKTIAYHMGASIETENLLYDAETGGIVVSSVQNEFNDREYSFTYPAHWAYDNGMGQAYKNTGIILNQVNLSDTNIKVNGTTVIPKQYLVSGDECILESSLSTIPVRAYVYKGNDGEFNLIDVRGFPIVGQTYEEFTIKVIRSGRKNMQSLPIGQITTLKNPINGTIISFDSILSSSAVEYSDDWKMFGENLYIMAENCDVLNGDFYKALNLSLTATRQSTFYSCSTSVNGTGYGTYPNGLYSIDSMSLKRLYDSSNAFRVYHNDTCRAWFSDPEIAEYLDDSTWVTMNHYIDVACYFDSTLFNSYQTLCDELTDVDDKASIGNEFIINFAMLEGGCRCVDYDFQGLRYHLYSNQLIPFKKILYFKNPQPYSGNLPQGTGEWANSPGEEFQFQLTAVMEDNSEIQVFGYNACMQLFANCSIECIDVMPDPTVNPYKAGLKGNWRKSRDWAYLGQRDYNSEPRNRTDGTFKNSEYTGFWQVLSKDTMTNKEMGSYYTAPKTNPRWVWSNEVTIYSPYGPELENRDALYRYSSALYGFNHSVPFAVANNAMYKQIGYEGFEDFDFPYPCDEYHWSFLENIDQNAFIDSMYKHSGKFSLKVITGDSQSVIRSMLNLTDTSARSTNHTYVHTVNDNIGVFNPDSGVYVIGAWLKDSVSAYDTSFLQPTIKVILKNNGTIVNTYSFKASGKIIEGWQRLEGVFTIPSSGVNTVEVKLMASSSHCSWFDDLRIHPFNSNMKSYAYDPITLRLMAEMDENNYASFYEYDQEGNLMRVKKETENGISTLKESRSSIKKR